MPNEIPSIEYTNKVDELDIFSSRHHALSWLKKNQLNTEGTPLLVPFYENNVIKFLKPTDQNDRLRVIGAANHIRNKEGLDKFVQWYNRAWKRDFVPHVNDLEGEDVQINSDGFLVIYHRGSQPAGEKLAKFYQREKEELIKIISRSVTNQAKLNEAKFIQDLSQLAIDLNIQSGFTYFYLPSSELGQSVRVLRHNFKENVTNERMVNYLKVEEDSRLAKAVSVNNAKRIDHHLGQFFREVLKGVLTTLFTAMIVGFILSLFVVPFVAGLIAALTAIIGVAMSVWSATNRNQDTIEFGESSFDPLPHMGTAVNKSSQAVGLDRPFFGWPRFIANPSQPLAISSMSRAPSQSCSRSFFYRFFLIPLSCFRSSALTDESCFEPSAARKNN